jgi:hypothetical protein
MPLARHPESSAKGEAAVSATYVVLDATGLLDYFAAAALPALVARPGGNLAIVAASAYKIADALLAERQKQWAPHVCDDTCPANEHHYATGKAVAR